ncbi:hypothetical protein L1887_58631 [Cichorium endivia]|nr:hypothetical protein L1887_58631 [Cichorium endivia]
MPTGSFEPVDALLGLGCATEESLLFAADGVDAAGTPEQHLLAGVALGPDVFAAPVVVPVGRALDVGEVRCADLGHGADEGGFVVERLCALERDAVLLGFLLQLNVDLVERLDVVAGEGDGHDDGVLVALLCPALDGVAGLRAEPSGGTHLRLPCDSVRVAPLEPRHDGSHGSRHLGRVGVTAARDDLHGQRMRAEHDGHLVALVLRIRVENGLNAVGECLDEQRMCGPSVDERPRDVAFGSTALFAPLDLAVELVEVAAGGAAAVLRVLCEADGTGDAVLCHLVERLFGERSGVAEGDIDLVGRGLRVELVEQLGHGLSLRPSPAQDGRASADLVVLVDDLGRPPACDEWGEARLKRELDELAVVKETREKVADLLGGGSGGTTHVHEQDARGRLCCLGRMAGQASAQRGGSCELEGGGGVDETRTAGGCEHTCP